MCLFVIIYIVLVVHGVHGYITLTNHDNVAIVLTREHKLNFCEQHKNFEKYFCHVNKISST
jgi:hypothetical protein